VVTSGDDRDGLGSRGGRRGRCRLVGRLVFEPPGRNARGLPLYRLYEAGGY